MKIKHLRRGLIALFALFLALAFWAGFTPPVSASAAIGDIYISQYDYELVKYDVKMNVKETREIEVVENISVRFYARDSHGIIRDLPLESGVRYRHISALRDGESVYTRAQTDDMGFLSFYIGWSDGPYLSTGKDYLYTISYTMVVPKLGEEGYLPLDVVGYGWEVPIYDFTAEITVPSGLKKDGYTVYSGWGSTENERGVTVEQTGNKLLLQADWLGTSGVTLDLSFESGVLKTSVDPAVFWAIGLGVGLILLALLLKLLLCRQPMIIRSVGLEAPKGMDPLLMGAIIDNQVDPEELGALVFWLASKGYIKIDLSENDEDPNLIRMVKNLPPETPDYIVDFFAGLFRRGDMVRVSSLKNSFYTTADSVKKKVNAKKGKLYATRGTVIFCVLWALTVVLLSGFAYLYGMATVALTYRFGWLIPLCVFAFLPPAIAGTAAVNRTFKWKKSKCILISALGLLGGLLVALVAFLFPSAAFIPAVSFILVGSSAVVGMIASLCGLRTKDYSEKLGLILGFKDFIRYTEQDRIRVMLEEEPELYYSILPYAQVLGVSDVWTEKFKGLDTPAPSYVTSSTGRVVLNLVAWGVVFHALNHSFARTFVSRPSARGGGGGHGGGFGGGFGGGGFGGGGGRRF